MKHSEKLENLVVVGIEPFSNALATAQERIMSFSTALSFEVEFIARQEYIEQMDFASLHHLPGMIVVNASLALHHIQSEEQRLKTIESVKSLNPAAFVLIEPNVNHFEPDLMKRLKQCFHHFTAFLK
ncbi:MAG: hypothetical protein IPM92_08025 [Saprospiraceae bacterium]|nr:hypothetical protein [Saprospiraceae bacterium]